MTFHPDDVLLFVLALSAGWTLLLLGVAFILHIGSKPCLYSTYKSS